MRRLPLLLRDDVERYGLVTRAFHWLLAALLLWQFGGIIAWRLIGDTPFLRQIFSLGPTHGEVGVLTLVLASLRASWSLASRDARPRRERGLPGVAARVVHASFYGLMIAIPALALVRAYGNGKGYSPWDWPLIPATGREIPWMMAPADALHGVLAWAFCVLIAVHIAAALHHGLIRRDGVLQRMAG